MKHIFNILTILALFIAPAFAQDAEMMQKAQERFKSMQTLEANVTMTKHNTMVTKDVTSQGKFYFKKPSRLCMVFNGGKDALLMDGQTFTMIADGKKQSMSGNGNTQLEALKSLMQNFSAGQESDVDLSDIADVDMERNGNVVIMTITPIVSDPKQKRKQMFQSFVVTIDTKAGELRSVRLNEKGQNYTQYDFSAFKVNAEVKDNVFVL